MPTYVVVTDTNYWAFYGKAKSPTQAFKEAIESIISYDPNSSDAYVYEIKGEAHYKITKQLRHKIR